MHGGRFLSEVKTLFSMPAPVAELRKTALVGTLRSCQLFQGLPDADISVIAGFTLLRSVAKDAYLFREGERSEGFYVIQKGAINVHRVSLSGKEQVIYVFRPGESLAEASLASATGYPANARAIEASTVLLIPRDPFLDLIGRKPELGLRMLASMSQHLRVLVGLVEDFTLKNVETRLVNLLLSRVPVTAAGEAEINLKETKRVLAAQLATSSETLSRTLAKLRDEGLVVVHGAKIRIKCAEALRNHFRRLLGEN